MSNNKTTLTVTLTNGTKATRTTDHAYTHVVVGTFNDGSMSVIQWSHTERAAAAGARTHLKRGASWAVYYAKNPAGHPIQCKPHYVVSCTIALVDQPAAV